MAEEEKTPFVEEICRGQSRDDSEAANASYLEAEKEVSTPMQYTEIFKLYEYSVENFMFLTFAQNIDSGYTLEPPL